MALHDADHGTIETFVRQWWNAARGPGAPSGDQFNYYYWVWNSGPEGPPAVYTDIQAKQGGDQSQKRQIDAENAVNLFLAAVAADVQAIKTKLGA